MEPRTASCEYRRSFDAAERRRSMELARSARRYDEYWGAAERADTRLKCKDNTIHHVHSQILSCWSPVLRDMITQQPAHSLVESTHGLAYLLAVPEEGAAWAALLDMLYPSCPLPSSWELLERVLLLAHKYEMAGVLQRGAQHVLTAGAGLSLDPAADNYALRWLNLAEKLQLPQLQQFVVSWVQPQLPALAANPAWAAAWMSYSSQHLSRELLLQLMEATLAALRDAGMAAAQQQPSAPQQRPLSSLSGSSWQQQQQQQQRQQQQLRTNDWVMSGDNGMAEAQPKGFTYGPGCGGDAAAADEAEDGASSSGDGPSTNSQAGPGEDPAWMDSGSSLAAPDSPKRAPSPTRQQRLAMCLTSGLYGAQPAPADRAQSAAAAAAFGAAAAAFGAQPCGFGGAGLHQLPGIPTSRKVSLAPGLDSVMEVDGMAEALGMGGVASRALPGSRRRSLAY